MDAPLRLPPRLRAPRRALLLALLALTACREAQTPEPPADPPAAPPPASASPPASAPREAPAVSAGGAPTAGGGGAITPARIDAFLAYQERRLVLESALWKELGAQGLRRGGAAAKGNPAPSRESLALLERRAQEDAEAMAAVGLSAGELSTLGIVVREVLGPRRLARELGLEETAELLEEQAERLSGPHRAELLAQVAPVRARLEELWALSEARARHGEAAVEAVLAREEALLAWEDARLSALAGP